MAKKAKIATGKKSSPAVRPRRRTDRPKARAQADGRAAVRAYFRALPASQREIAARFDALVASLVPHVDRIIKWKIPFYGVPGNGWFVSCMGGKSGVRITFFQGAALKPPPPLGGKQPRGVDLLQPKDVDAARISSWIRQASRLPGYAS